VLSRRQCINRGGSETNNEQLVQWAEPEPKSSPTNQPPDNQPTVVVLVRFRFMHRWVWIGGGFPVVNTVSSKTTTASPHPLLKTASTGLPHIHVTKTYQEFFLPPWLQLDYLYN
jgi:hypothetical protein